MQDRIGMVAADLPKAASLGLSYARQGAAVRIFVGCAGPDELRERLSLMQPQVAIMVTDGDTAREEEAGAILRAWEEGEPPRRDQSLGLPAEESLQAEEKRLAASGVLVLVGSCAQETRAQVERLADEGALLLTLHREAVLNQDESYLMGIRSGAAVAAGQGRNVIVRSENWPEALLVTRKLAARVGVSGDELASRVRNLLGRIGEGVTRGVVAAEGVRKLIVVGTETSRAVCDRLGITELAVLRETAGGLPVLETPGPDPLLMVLKAGGAGEPDTLARAVADLRSLKIRSQYCSG